MEIIQQEKFMKKALAEAEKAKAIDEVPIGAVIVQNGKIIARAYNKRNKGKIATHHAEILAIEKACKKIGDWRLENCEIYVTLEPCPMCAGAIANARIKKLVFGAFDTAGTNKNLLSDILQDTRLNHKVEIEGGVLEEKCRNILTTFFKAKRK
ncbi:MAG: tRNA adenosine(34) deaminase TadA [Clostridia bacterium]|nr:tRNA adenosine(34) deaminase TadA [Clostridia bacterium]